MPDHKLKEIANLMVKSKNTVVVTGAGISTEAGIRDFRGKDGIYTQLGEAYVTGIIHINTFRRDPEKFYAFYRKYFTLPKVRPSLAHEILAEMERNNRIQAIVTQNVDGLHQKAGNQKVFAIHGSRSRYICTGDECTCFYDADYVENYPEVVPRCSVCGSVLKPDVVLFGENIKEYGSAYDAVMGASLLLVIGTSLAVYPIAGFVREYALAQGKMIIINKGPTELDSLALIKIDVENTGETLKKINRYYSDIIARVN
jgi:NAD-dependent deacetylase